MPRRLTFAVISDIHATEDPAADDTYVVAEPPPSLPKRNPFADLLRFLDESGLRADWLLVPGDIANRASVTGTTYAWRQAIDVARALGARGITATPGNHDLDTHHPAVDPVASLRALAPSFPTTDMAIDSQFWTYGYALQDEDPDFRILNVNSCWAFPPHPGPGASQAEINTYFEELNRGSFSRDQHVRVSRDIDRLSPKPVNIALIHHHPLEHQRMDLFKDTYGPMHAGGELVQLLEENDRAGRWMIVHGHKHVPSLSAGGSSANSPIMLCAASLGGALWHPVVTVTRNQFHIVDFELDEVPGVPRTRGVVRSFMWGYGTGWKRAEALSGLPHVAGFGLTMDHRAIADLVEACLDRRGVGYIAWDAAEAEVVPLRYQLPEDFERFEDELDRRGIEIERNHQGDYLTIARRLA